VTATDKAAISAMLEAGQNTAFTARKSYKVEEYPQGYEKLLQSHEKSLQRAMSWEVTTIQRAIKAIKRAMEQGRKLFKVVASQAGEQSVYYYYI
jgi:hypothetical protein